MTTPLVSYRDLIKNAKDKVQARKELKEKIQREISSQQTTISQAARSLITSRNTIKKLLGDEDLNYEAKKAPKSSPLNLIPLIFSP